MNIVISDKAYITNYSSSFLAQIKNMLTITNPLFLTKQNLNLSTWGIPEYLKYYEIKNNTLIIPIGILPQALLNYNYQVTDNRFSNPTLKIKFLGTLRPYQEELVNAFNERTVGIVVAMTGSGKTASFINLITKLKEPTIIAVNTIELVNQTISAIEKFTDYKNIGLIGNGQFNIQPITVALHQTLSNLSDEQWEQINSTFGLLIADEVHIVAANTFYQNVTRCKCKYRFGFTATLNRTDGLTPLIHAAIGPLIHTVDNQHLKENVIIPTFEYYDTDYYFPLLSTSEYTNMITDLSNNIKRNQLIISIRNKYPDNYALLLCLREDQVQYLQQNIPNSVALTSKISKKERKQIMEDILNKKYNTVISTYGLFSTGLDVPHLNLLIFCAPIKSEIKIRQSIGRIMRPATEKNFAKIIDIIDKKVELLKIQSYIRKRIYKKLEKSFEA